MKKSPLNAKEKSHFQRMILLKIGLKYVKRAYRLSLPENLVKDEEY